jgi:hypothetical protein
MRRGIQHVHVDGSGSFGWPSLTGSQSLRRFQSLFRLFRPMLDRVSNPEARASSQKAVAETSYGLDTNRERSSTDVKPGWTFVTGCGRAASQVWSE